MACPFARKFNLNSRQSSVTESNTSAATTNPPSSSSSSTPHVISLVENHPSIVSHTTTTILGELESGDSLSLEHLQRAIQLLTSPSNEHINAAITSLVSKYNQKWPKLSKLKVEPDIFEKYPNYDYLADIQDILLEMDEDSASEILVSLGEEIIASCCTPVLRRAFRCLGFNVEDFLGSLDGVHDVLKLKEEDITDTGFIYAGEGELIFYTERPVVAWLLLGSLKSLIKLLYDIIVTIKIEPVEDDAQRYRFIFDLPKEEIEEDNNSSNSIALKNISTNAEDLQLSPSTFCIAFPWHFVLNEQLEIIQLGSGFCKFYKPYLDNYGRFITTYFSFKRPRGLSFKFDELMRRTNTPFLISLKTPPGMEDFIQEGLEIKGQMVYCPESNSLLFIGSPFLDGLDGLTSNGLFISDIPIHDATREVILVGEQSRAQDSLRRRMDKLKTTIEEANTAVTKERKKNVSLLHLIFPADIAERLWKGEIVDAKTHSNVTILFSDIVGFTSICSRATPFMVITMLESLYKDFDEFCGFFDVYKVETIGDAYCIAGGLHKVTPYDAHKVAWMAIRMIQSCSQHVTHEGEPIRMRIGLHTGTVLAGVVGRKMPRYCLFGHNVTLANKFESGSEACKINISPTTREWLIKYPEFDFHLQPRDPSCLPKDFPNPGNSTCYFLEGYHHPQLDKNASVQEHVEAAMQSISDE